MLKSLKVALLIIMFAALFVACGSGDDDTETVDGDTSGDGDADDASDGDAEDVEQAVDGDSEIEVEEKPFDDPQSEGKYMAAATRFTVTYEDPDVPGRMRELPCVVWYPTNTEGEDFMVDGWWKREDVHDSVPPAMDEAPYPFVAFSHGNSGLAEQSWTMTEYLARHGIVTASCNHVGNTAGDFQHDGEEKIPQSVHDRPHDVAHMIEEMIAMSESADHLIAGTVDKERVAASGHSLGGFTTLVVSGAHLYFQDWAKLCETAPETSWCDVLEEADTSMVMDGTFGSPLVKAAVAFAPMGYQFFSGAKGLADIEIPMLVMAADRDGTCPLDTETRPIYEALTNQEKVFVVSNDTGHMSFSNICDLIGPINDYLKEEGCGDDFQTPEQVFGIMNHYTLAYLRMILDKDERYRQYFVPEDPAKWGMNATLEIPESVE